MKKLPIVAFIALVLIISTQSCKEASNLDYRQEMRDFVIGISDYSKDIDPGFMIIPQNGIELVSVNGEENGQAHTLYLGAIDGNGQEDLFFGYKNDDQATNNNDRDYLISFLDISKDAGNTILVTDYCSTSHKVDSSYSWNDHQGYVSFAANHRELDVIPSYPFPLYHSNNDQIATLDEAQNFLYLINPENFASKSDFINAVNNTNYDLLIIDLFFDENTTFSSSEVDMLKQKSNGGSRLVLCYMSIGEAEDYRYYWDTDWDKNKPSWLDDENPSWPGNYKVKYWNTEWQQIIFGNADSYLKMIVDAHFDGVYLDIIDAYEYFE